MTYTAEVETHDTRATFEQVSEALSLVRESDDNALEMVTPNGGIFLIDREDLERVSKFGLWVSNGYILGWNRDTRKIFILSRFITGAPDGLDVDHISGNTLDNRKCNLRVCTRAENLRNKRNTGPYRFKGIHYYKSRNKWTAQIRVNGKLYRLGYFMTDEEAARAYDAAARKYHGEFARLNFSD